MKKRFLLITLVSCFATVLDAQVIYTIAGTGAAGSTGDGGPATSATLSSPGDLFYDKKGNLYFTDYNKVRKINTAGIISTIAGTGGTGYGGDGGPAIYAQTNAAGIAVDSIGNIYIADHDGNVIRKVDTFGIITTIVGDHSMGNSGDGGPAISAKINQPVSLAFNNHGELFIGDMNHVIRKIDLSGIITTFAGDGVSGSGGDGGPASAASFIQPQCMVFDKNDNLFVSDYQTNRIRRIDATTGIITTVVGNGTLGYGGDGGLASSALIHYPLGIAIDTGEALYFNDVQNFRLRKIDSGFINTFAGTGIAGFSGDGGNPLFAKINASGGVVLDRKGNIVFVDQARIRIIKTGSDGVKTEEGEQNRASIYPNPCGGHFMLHIAGVNNSLGKVEIVISNAIGDIVSRFEANTNLDIPIKLNRIPGIYQVRIITSSGTIIRKLLIN